MDKNKLLVSRVILVLIILVSFGTALGVIGYLLSPKKSSPIVVQSTPKAIITPIPEPTLTPTPESTTISTPIPLETPNINISEWKDYKNKNLSLEFKYPLELFIAEKNQKIIIDALKPDDPMQHTSTGIISKMTISPDARGVQEIINEYKNNNLNSFSTEQILINGVKTTRITFRGAYAGEMNYVVLIRNEKKAETIVIYYMDNSVYQKTFEQILFTFKLFTY